jgi:serine/threonine protein kinase
MKQIVFLNKDATFKNYVKEEAIRQSKFKHENIVFIFEYFETNNGIFCIVMEYVNGGDL